MQSSWGAFARRQAKLLGEGAVPARHGEQDQLPFLSIKRRSGCFLPCLQMLPAWRAWQPGSLATAAGQALVLAPLAAAAGLGGRQLVSAAWAGHGRARAASPVVAAPATMLRAAARPAPAASTEAQPVFNGPAGSSRQHGWSIMAAERQQASMAPHLMLQQAMGSTIVGRAMHISTPASQRIGLAQASQQCASAMAEVANVKGKGKGGEEPPQA